MRKSILALSLLAAVAGPAIAQTSPARLSQPLERPDRPDRAAMRKAHADDVALLVGLRDEQRAGLDAVLDHPMFPDGGPDRGPMAREPGAAPLSFADRLAEIENRDAASRKRVAEIKAFYQGLDAQQRARFEAVMR